jgi:VWFA-related protein
MSSPTKSVAVFLLAGALLAPSLGGADKKKPDAPTVREEARVTVVEVPVNVIDKAGNPVENLTAEDFEIFDDGKKQPVTGFEILDQRKPLAARPSDDPVNPAARRHFLLVFDLSFGTPKAVVNARRAARDFVVTRMKDLDMAAVATFSVEQGMRLLVTFTRDRTQLSAAIDTLGIPTLADRTPDPLGFTIIPPSQSNAQGFQSVTGQGAVQTNGADAAFADVLEALEVNRARSFRAIYRDRVSRLLRSFEQTAVALNEVPGRKHILYMSEGFDSRELSGSTADGGGAKEANWAITGQSWKIDSDARWGNSNLQNLMEKALAFFNRSDCVIHSIDIGGLRAGSDISAVDAPVNGQDSLFYMAKETGGEFLKNANDLGPAFDKLLDRTGLIYLLAFQPVRIPENGKFHELKVKVKNASYRVSARTGYYEPKKRDQITPLERKLAASSLIASAVPQTEIPAWVFAAAFPAPSGLARVPVIVEIPADRLLAKHKDPMMNLDVYVYAVDSAGATRDYIYQPIGLELAKIGEKLKQAGVKFYGQLNLPPGDYSLRTLVRDNETDRTGLTVTPVRVPDAKGAPFATPPIFLAEGRTWVMVKAKPRQNDDPKAEYPFAIGGESFVPAALASMHSGDAAQVCLIAYNFPSEAAAITYAGRALGVDGKAHGKVDLKLIRSSDQEHEGQRKLLLQFRPSGLEPGRYALAVRLLDPKTGKSSESSFPFDVF